jgi:hypothetical protein
MMKKGDMSLNLIIVAAILMVIFVVLIVIFSGRMGIFRGSIEKCSSYKGTCVKDSCSGAYEIEKTEYACDLNGNAKYNEGKAIDGVCCISVPSS